MRTEKKAVDLAVAEWQEYNEIKGAGQPSRPKPVKGRPQQEEEIMSTIVGCTMVYISACNMNHGQAGIGGHAVDNQGSILRSWAVTRVCTSIPVALTLLAICYAQVEAEKCGWKRIIIRSDAQDIATKLQFHHELV